MRTSVMLDTGQLRRAMPPDRLPLRGLCCAIALGGVLLGATGAGAEIFKKEDLLRGTTITHAQCDATPQTMWLNVDGRDFCVRYYLSTAGGEGSRPVVILQGDQLGKFNFKSLTWIDTSDAKDVDTDDIVRTADNFSKMTKTTTIYLGRIGVDGTSGNHMMRSSQLELDLTGAALDALKRRYGFEGFHLAGQSGGSKLLAGLIGLRRDIGCAVMGSPPLVTPDARKSSDQGRTAFEPSVSQLVQNRAVRLFAGKRQGRQEGPDRTTERLRRQAASGWPPGAAVLRRGDRRSAARRSRLYRTGHRGLRSRPAGR